MKCALFLSLLFVLPAAVRATTIDTAWLVKNSAPSAPIANQAYVNGFLQAIYMGGQVDRPDFQCPSSTTSEALLNAFTHAMKVYPRLVEQPPALAVGVAFVLEGLCTSTDAWRK